MHMGGAKERIDVKMIAHPDQDQKEAHEELSRKFASFNAKDAQCSKQEDRQKLLAVIEAAFGDYKEFNRDVRHVFASRVSRDSGDSPGSRVGSSSFISRLRSHARVLTWSLWQAAPSPPRRRTGFFDTLSGAHRRLSRGLHRHGERQPSLPAQRCRPRRLTLSMRPSRASGQTPKNVMLPCDELRDAILSFGREMILALALAFRGRIAGQSLF